MLTCFMSEKEGTGFVVGKGFQQAAKIKKEVIIPMVINLDVTDRSGKTALHHAAFNGHLEMLSLLQLKGANVRVVDGVGGQDPLHFAAFIGKFQHLKFSICSSLWRFVP